MYKKGAGFDVEQIAGGSSGKTMASKTGTIVIRVGTEAHAVLTKRAKAAKQPVAYFAQGILFGFEKCLTNNGQPFPMPELPKRGRVSKYAGMTKEQIAQAKKTEREQAAKIAAQNEANAKRLAELREAAKAAASKLPANMPKDVRALLDSLLAAQAG